MNKKIFSVLICFLFSAFNVAFCEDIKMPPPKNAQNVQHQNDFAKKLNLTDEQILQIKKNNEISRKKIEQIRQENKRAFEAILTPEQKQKLQEMKPQHQTNMQKNRKNMQNPSSWGQKGKNLNDR